MPPSLCFELGVLALDAMLFGELGRSVFGLCLSVLFSLGDDCSPFGLGDGGSWSNVQNKQTFCKIKKI